MDFETTCKDKLPRNLVFPVSASILHEKLADVPQKSQVCVSYSNYKGLTARSWHHSHNHAFGKSKQIFKQKLQNIIEATYERSAVSVYTPRAWQQQDTSFSRDQWKLHVNAIRLGDLATVRECLEKEGYAAITTWFIETNKHAGSIGRHSLTIEFDGQQLTYKQSDRQ